MAINITDDGKVIYENTPDVSRELMPNISDGEVYAKRAEDALDEIRTTYSDITDIAEQIEETAESIPEDYTQLAEDVADLKADLKQHNSFDWLKPCANYQNVTHNGITFTWNADKTAVTISGTSTAQAFINLYHNLTILPEGFEAGKTYYVLFDNTSQYIAFAFIFYDSNGTVISNVNKYTNNTIAIPSGCVGITIRILVAANKTVSNVVTNIAIISAMTNSQLTDGMSDLTEKVDNILPNLTEYNAYDTLRPIATYTSTTTNGIRFQWNSEYTQCTVNGTATANAFTNLYYNLTELPDGLSAGKPMYIKFKTTDVFVGLVFAFYDDNANLILNRTAYGDRSEVIPDNAKGMFVRLFVSSGRTINNAVVSNIAILNSIDQKEVTGNINNIMNVVAKYYNFSVASGTLNGITFAWSNDRSYCDVTGTSNGVSFNNILSYANQMPSFFKAGETYYFDFENTDENIFIEFLVYNQNVAQNGTVWRINKRGYVTIPASCEQFGIRLRVLNGVSVNGRISDITIYGSLPNKYNVRKIDSYKIPLLISFVDDDTTNDTFVTKYYQACKHNGIVGNYAVMTKPIENGDTSVEKLLEYEGDHFGMLIHCYDQRGEDTNYWKPENRDLALCSANLAKGLRDMQSYGFVNYNYWITPYGVKDDEMVSLARTFGFKCLASYDDIYMNECGSANRYQIKRISFRQNDDTYRSSMAGVKAIIDSLADSEFGGWLVITTHFNEWGSLSWDENVDSSGYPIGYSRFNELAQYAKSSGAKIVSFAEGFSYIEPYLIN